MHVALVYRVRTDDEGARETSPIERLWCNYVPVMNKDMKMIHSVLQFVLCNSSRCHYLEPLRKGVMEKMAYLVEF
jgi:hypothetical protein